MARTTCKSEILVFKAKHETAYYDASTPEKRAAAFLHVLRENYNAGWYYAPAEPSISAAERGCAMLTDEQLAALPATAAADLRAQRARAARALAAAEQTYAEELRWWDTATELVALPTAEALARAGTHGYASAAEELLAAHSDYEYEGYAFESFVNVEV